MSNSFHFQAYPIFVLENPEYWLEKVTFKFPFSTEATWIMIATLNGSFSFTVNGVSGQSTMGNILLVPPKMTFYRKVIDPLSSFYIRFVYDDTALNEEQRLTKLLEELYGYNFMTPEQDRLFNNYRNLLNLFEKNDNKSRKWITHFIYDIWLLFSREAESLRNKEINTYDPLMKKVKEKIDQQAFSNIKLKDIAKMIDLHPVQFTRRFQNTYGITPSQYLISLRIENAKMLLIQTNYTIDHVAQLCGYNNGFYFSRVFTNYTKMNPSIFREIHRIQTL